MEFDKKKCLANIYFLAKKKEIKIGDIERKANVSAGYLSRLNKEDSSTNPSVEFLSSAADSLGVTIDALINVDWVSPTATETYVIEFIEKLIVDSQVDKLKWEKETPRELSEVVIQHDGPSHPLYAGIAVSGGYDAVYDSKFNENCIIDGDCYKLEIGSSFQSATVYLMSVTDTDLGNETPFDYHGYELYLVERWKPTPLASSQNMVFEDVLSSLYSAVRESYIHPKLEQSVMNIIDSFMGKQAPNPFDTDDGDLPF